MGATYNLARTAQLATPVVVGLAVARYGLAGGLGVPCLLALATASWVWVLPETRGIALPRLSFDGARRRVTMTMMKDVFIVSAARTPIGAFQGALAPLSAPKLGAIAIKAALERAGRPARRRCRRGLHGLRAARGPGPGAGASGGASARACRRRAVHDGQQGLRLGPEGGDARRASAIAAGERDDRRRGRHGVDVATCRTCCRRRATATGMGTRRSSITMIHDGLWDPYDNQHMGDCAELCARRRGITREQQDEFATESYRRALRGAEVRARSSAEIVAGRGRRSARAPTSSTTDEEPGERRHREDRRRCARRSRRTARSRPATRRRSTTAPRRSC